ncbi:MAG: hypothetical protein M0R32_10525 [Candidatus Cloacimonetes bacterium]|jgi:hypothetical protein|nr:hypothetical protein [Candidatus Cloacimonadota bacterium]
MNKFEETSQAYKDYMALANECFENIKNKICETEERQKEIAWEQNKLWNLMTPEEQIEADETVLRTTIYLQASKEKY